MIDWLNMMQPFADPGAANAFAPGGPAGGVPGMPNIEQALKLMAFTAPEEIATMMAKQGMRPNPNALVKTPEPIPMPGSNEMAGTPGVDTTGAAPTGMPNPQGGVKPTGPAGLTGVPSQSSVLRALGAVKAVQPPAPPMIPAPSTPRIDSPPVYKPDPNQLMAIMSMMQPGGGQMPTLAQLMGGMR